MNKVFVFHNPHVEIWYKTPLFHFITKRVSVQKYVHLIDYFLERNEKIVVLVDNSNSGIPNKKIRALIPPVIEFYLWALVNKINPFKFKVITDINKLTEQHVLFTFIYGNFTSQHSKFITPRDKIISQFANTKAFKVAHATHYMYNSGLASKNSKEAGIDLFVAENNLSKNSAYFKHYFPWYMANIYNLPFVPKKRYHKYIPFNKRINKAIATGTITYPMEETDFSGFYKHTMVHPMRTAIYENKDRLTDYVDSFVSKITEGEKVIGKSASNKFKKAYYYIFNRFSDSQKKYFSFNIVEKYNEYKMFIVPEEVNDLPGIGFAEGMACGAAFIGLDDPMYTDLGMQNGVHFIAYNGTIEDLESKIKYYQEHQAELETIAEKGYNFALTSFNKEKVCKDFFEYLNINV